MRSPTSWPRKAELKRAIVGGPPGSGKKLIEFIERSRDFTKALVSEKDLPEFAAQALQAATVSLAEKRRTDEAITAVDAAIEFGQIALDRGADLSAQLDHVTAVSLKAEIHRMRGEARPASEAAAKARALFSAIHAEDAEGQGLGDRFRQVADIIGAPATGGQP